MDVHRRLFLLANRSTTKFTVFRIIERGGWETAAQQSNRQLGVVVDTKRVTTILDSEIMHAANPCKGTLSPSQIKVSCTSYEDGVLRGRPCAGTRATRLAFGIARGNTDGDVHVVV